MNQTQQTKINKQLAWMIFIALGMFGFGFALVPLYNVFCNVTGINGKTQMNDTFLSDIPIDTSRLVTIELLGATNQNMPAKFFPQTKKFTIHPGEFVDTAYFVENLSNQDMTLQAIPSVAPGLAGTHVKKQVCFCFQNQSIKANQTMKMPLRFTVDPKLPKKYSTITLAYTIFDVTS